jgi:hypothetical protein
MGEHSSWWMFQLQWGTTSKEEKQMKLDVKALAITMGLIWGGALLAVGLANLVWPAYGGDFLRVMAAIYPGYAGGSSIGQVIVGTLYGVVDGAIGGAIFGWIYNSIARG